MKNNIFDRLIWIESGSSTYDPDEEADPTSVLLGSLKLGSSMFHVEAIRVVVDDNGRQEPEDPCLSADFAHIENLCGDYPLETIEIKGYKGKYVVAIYPQAT
jgi:hypothetical protein